MPEYAFLTTWLLESPREPVWDVLHDQAAWPEWWRGVEVAEEVSRPPGGEDVGTVSRMVWRGPLPYRVEFEVLTTRVERPTLLEGRASGDLAGLGRWRLYEQEGITAVLYEWNVRHDAALDEPPGAAAASGLRVEPRLGDGARRRGPGGAARLPPARRRLKARARA